MDKIIIKCPKYEDSFRLRKVLINLHINWACNETIYDFNKWVKEWNWFNTNTIYFIENDKLYLGCIFDIIPLNQTEYANWSIYNSVNEFVKNNNL